MATTPASACTCCGGSRNNRALTELVEACAAAGLRRLVVVGGSPDVRRELGVAKGELELRLIDGTERRTRAEAQRDLDWTDLIVIAGSSELGHKVSSLYTRDRSATPVARSHAAASRRSPARSSSTSAVAARDAGRARRGRVERLPVGEVGDGGRPVVCARGREAGRIGCDPDARQVEPVGVPAGANGRVGRDESVRVLEAGVLERVKLFRGGGEDDPRRATRRRTRRRAARARDR